MAATFDLSGKSVLITGAARGLGRALAIGAAQAGASVTAFDIDQRRLAELRQAFPAIATQMVDVVDRAAFAAAALQIGRIDAVVNNAMLIRYDPIEAVDDAIVDQMLAIGIKGAVWGVQALLRHMDPAVGGVVLNLASPTAEYAAFQTPPSTAWSKVRWALLPERWPPNLDRAACASMHWRRVQSRRPERSRSRRAPAGRRLSPSARRGFPLRRLGREQDATSASLYLLSDAASFVTGEILHVDERLPCFNSESARA